MKGTIPTSTTGTCVKICSHPHPRVTIKKRARRFLEWLKLMRESFGDAQRYYHAASWAGPVPAHHLTHLEAEVIKHYHVLEKALAMPDFRPRAGSEVLRNLLHLICTWQSTGASEQAFHVQASLGVINAYRRRHLASGVDISDLFGDCSLPAESAQLPCGSSRPLESPAMSAEAFDQLLESRHSTRNFDTTREVPSELLESAVRVASSAPSVCNRQTWRVHFYRDDFASRILAHQNGNRGFGHLIRCVGVVTSDMRLFASTVERYQAWIEGGLFSMQFLLALHARGVGCVALNWSRNNVDDRKLRMEAAIPDYERIIMLIGIGYPAEDHLVTCSPRPDANHFVRWHNS